MLKTIKISNFLREEGIYFNFDKPFINLYNETVNNPSYGWVNLSEIAEPDLFKALKFIKETTFIDTSQVIKINPIDEEKPVDIYIELKDGTKESIMLVDKKLFSKSITMEDGSYFYFDISFSETKDVNGKLYSSPLKIQRSLDDVLFLKHYKDISHINDPEKVWGMVEKTLIKLFPDIENVDLNFAKVRKRSSEEIIELPFYLEGSGFNQTVDLLTAIFSAIYLKKAPWGFLFLYGLGHYIYGIF